MQLSPAPKDSRAYNMLQRPNGEPSKAATPRCATSPDPIKSHYFLNGGQPWQVWSATVPLPLHMRLNGTPNMVVPFETATKVLKFSATFRMTEKAHILVGL